jgi:hypothetical protein
MWGYAARATTPKTARGKKHDDLRKSGLEKYYHHHRCLRQGEVESLGKAADDTLPEWECAITPRAGVIDNGGGDGLTWTTLETCGLLWTILDFSGLKWTWPISPPPMTGTIPRVSGTCPA